MRPYLSDVNVWLALALSGHAHHAAAAAWFEALEEPASVLFCRVTQQSFLRLLTTAAVLAPYGNPPLTNAEAWEVYEALLSDYRVSARFEEPGRLDRLWRSFALRQAASPKLWMDAYLAAFAAAAGYRLVTTDVAFRHFDGLDLVLVNDA